VKATCEQVAELADVISAHSENLADNATALTEREIYAKALLILNNAATLAAWTNPDNR